MKLFKDASNTVYAYEADGSQDAIIPADQVPITQAEADALRAPPPLTTDQLKTAAEAAIQNLLDNTAKAHGYDSILSLCSYATSTNLTWQKEGQYGCNYRDACWTKAEQIQTDATAGNWPTTGAGQVPTVNDVLAAMPAVVWPV